MKAPALPDTPASGVAIMAAAMLLAPSMDILAKLATETMSPTQTTLGRFAAQSLILLPLMAVGPGFERPSRLHLAGAVCLAIALLCIITAISVMPVANALAIFFVEPLLLTLLSVPLLGERLGWRRLSAVGVGLIGVLIVLRPNAAAFGWHALLPLGTAFFFALYMIVTRVLARRGSRLALQFWTGLLALVLLGAVTLALQPTGHPLVALTPIGRDEILLFLSVGAIAALTHQMIAQALARAEAGALAPLQYLEIFSATLLGWLVFAEFPDPLTWVGAAIIVVAGLYVVHRERAVGAGDPIAGPDAGR